MEKTNWFPAAVKPARPGAYECGYYFGDSHESRMRVWVGTKWAMPNGSTPCGFGSNPKDQWRGLTEKAT